MKKEYDKWLDLTNEGIKIYQLPKENKPKGIHVVGIIPDLHIPWHNKKALDFLSNTFQTRGVTDIVIIGDFFDNYWRSRKYIKDYNVMGPTEEYKAAMKSKKLFENEFPYVNYVLGNHDARLTANVNDGFVGNLKDEFRRVFELPSTWNIENQFIIDNVCYHHGTGTSGQNAAMTMLRTKRMSTVIGHTHSFAGVQFSNNGIETNFALNVGCLVDLKAPVFDYGLNNREKPVLGCGVVYNSHYAEFVPLV
jgi:metallophosphoesterase superfamily enzyme